ncbi:MAG: 1-acyl-sn-glycerol-3-phosphate acyltransferase [Anaerolineae bacterium]|nr:1-acyl-sn-glycerol-3-phosphate acyltransferase [Anaerolineae bacterium]NIN96406.1 1-acyl-sn-glycerol-3-phosphate acyltransferase [Anaerolineae bacterium]NIQ79442.1 1-acyl-sn-glycerol-3-phosphate acyltransferase [Anaerolineae bacterium]
MRQASKRIVTVLINLLTRWEVEGKENLPPGGPLLMVFNHLAWWDAPLGMAAVPYEVTGIALKDLQRIPITGQLLSLANVIWVDRGRYDREALRRALAVLEQGGILAIAPEGRMSVTGALERGKPGSVFIARKADVPILPIGLTGTEKVLSEWRRFRRPHLRVVIGKVFRLPERRQYGSRKEERQADADYILERIAELLPPEYRGVYADTVE